MTKPVVHIAFLDVGQGDTIVVSIPETREGIIIDCADVGITLAYLLHAQVDRIRAVYITHLHYDHCKGVISLLENQFCERVFFDFPRLSAKQWQLLGKDDHSNEEFSEDGLRDFRIRLLNWKKEHPEQYRTLAWQIDMPVPLPESFQIIHPKAAHYEKLLSPSLNNTSGVFKVLGGNTSALLTGDLEPSGWEFLLKEIDNKSLLKSDILKFPHHGAWINSNPDDLLDVVQPSFVIVSVGTKKSQNYDHPNQNVFDALRERVDTKLFCTQVTKKCCLSPKIEKLATAKELENDAAENDKFYYSQNGCPCAGSIVIELGEGVRVIQPTIQLHRKIIETYFSQLHQCNLSRF